MTVAFRLIRKLMRHGTSEVIAIPREMREAVGLEHGDTVALYQLQGAVLLVPLRTLNSGQSQRTLEALLQNQD